MIGSLLHIRYEVVQDLDETPVFATYRAKDRMTGRDVRIRVVQGAFNEELAFINKLREIAERMKTIGHPGVEKVLDFDKDEGICFLVTEHLPGVTLEERIKRLSTFSAPVAISSALAILDGLKAIHTAGYVHGDVSARNVVSVSEEAVLLMGAGLWESYGYSSHAGGQMLRYMAPYLAPEVTAGQMPSQRSDVYAVGVLLYQMVAGRLPYPGETSAQIGQRHASEPVPSLRAVNPAVPAVLDEIVKKAMAKDPAQRYPSASSMRDDLQTLRDALRFGRTLHWPLSGQAIPEEPLPVTPPMSALEPAKAEAPPSKKPRPIRDEQDGVPAWLANFLWITTPLVLLVVGGWLYFNLQRPKALIVPNLVGMTIAQAQNQLESMGLRMRISRRDPSDKHPEGTVLDAVPAAGQSVKESATVGLIVSAGSRFVEVPDLRGRSLDEARSLLASINLELSDQIEYVRDRNAEEGMVIGQIPEQRKQVERLSKIRVRVASKTRGTATDAGDARRYLYRVRLAIPEGVVPVLVRVDMTDVRETRTIYEAEHTPGESVEAQAEGYGEEVTFRVFFDGEVVDQITQKAPSKVERPANEEER